MYAYYDPDTKEYLRGDSAKLSMLKFLQLILFSVKAMVLFCTWELNNLICILTKSLQLLCREWRIAEEWKMENGRGMGGEFNLRDRIDEK